MKHGPVQQTMNLVIFLLHNLSKFETLQTMWHRYYTIYHTSYYIYDYKSAEKYVKRECTSLCHQRKQLYKAGKITHLFVPPLEEFYICVSFVKFIGH